MPPRTAEEYDAQGRIYMQHQDRARDASWYAGGQQGYPADPEAITEPVDNPNARVRIRDRDLSEPVQEKHLQRSGGPLPDCWEGSQGYPICADWQWLRNPHAYCSRAAEKNKNGCRYRHRCGYLDETGEPCQNPPPCRLLVHYEQEWAALGHPPHWYQDHLRDD